MRWKDPDLPERVSGIAETLTGDLWVNGFSGIAHVSASELKNWLRDPGSTVSGEAFNELDGLPGLSGEVLPEPSLVEAPGGRLWFATTKGIAWLNPATFEDNRHRLPPLVVISTITSNGKTYAAASRLVLPVHTENVEIDYTALRLPIPERARFVTSWRASTRTGKTRERVGKLSLAASGPVITDSESWPPTVTVCGTTPGPSWIFTSRQRITRPRGSICYASSRFLPCLGPSINCTCGK